LAVAWWYIAQLPTSNLFVPNPGYPFAPRFLFLALVLPVVGVAGAFAVRAASRSWSWGVVVLVLVAFISMDRIQTVTWQREDGVFRILLAHDPSDTLARFNLGAYLLRVGQLRAAAEELESLRRGSAQAGSAAYLLGNTMRLLGRRNDAEGFYRTAARAAPGHVGATLELAEFAVDRGEVNVARRWIRPLVEMQDRPPRLVAHLEMLLARIAAVEGDCAVAKSRARMAVETWPHSSRLLFQAGVQLARCGDVEAGRIQRRQAADVAAVEIRSRVGRAW
jgi:Flp pilus assembly protein TadD